MSKTLKIHAACSVQNNVKDIEDIIKTNHNRFLTDFLEFISLFVGDIEDVYELQCTFYTQLQNTSYSLVCMGY